MLVHGNSRTIPVIASPVVGGQGQYGELNWQRDGRARTVSEGGLGQICFHCENVLYNNGRGEVSLGVFIRVKLRKILQRPMEEK